MGRHDAKTLLIGVSVQVNGSEPTGGPQEFSTKNVAGQLATQSS